MACGIPFCAFHICILFTSVNIVGEISSESCKVIFEIQYDKFILHYHRRRALDLNHQGR